MSWNDESWKAAARAYHAARRAPSTVLEVAIEPQRLRRLRRLLNDNISFERAWHELSTNHTKGRAAQSTVEALMYSLRERGVKALEESDTRRRLAQLDDEQLIEVGNRLQRLKPQIASAWTADEVKILIQAHGRLR
jgi:hypothetical protein